MKLRSVCIYCGANFNGNPELIILIEQLTEVLTSQGIFVVYGGGKVGLMGLVADNMLLRNGIVKGVIPQFLLDKEVGHTGVTELIITENMHQRKQKMADLSDSFLILPGGFGTLEELFEVLTWLQLGLHNKPIGILNFNGFYDPLIAQLDRMVEEGFLKPKNRDLLFVESDPSILINKMSEFSETPDEVWFKDRNLS
ncbi:TIGR00730 family Rossman fold protein [Pedobacter flavus]|uniref:Cytokinin riboside 5'-monophosphate phosphoribohydrolase n=1 Tax=Pedobacter flavus TaxID=3113906 RepID=A0ABU7H3G0_9SPHI|nr:TIGR00730 family Rossman fold protein [Pedobacter sp. VNH31]MEE1885753.1 TIGR00730 family Rossman fold protein [Pedobacter sp. VNH31]